MKLYRWIYDKSAMYYKKEEGVWYFYHVEMSDWERSCNPDSWFRDNVVLIGNNYRQK